MRFIYFVVWFRAYVDRREEAESQLMYLARKNRDFEGNPDARITRPVPCERSADGDINIISRFIIFTNDLQKIKYLLSMWQRS